MHLRTDCSPLIAGWKRALDLGNIELLEHQKEYLDPDYLAALNDPNANAVLNDAWEIWEDPNDHDNWDYLPHEDWNIAGYAFTCPVMECKEGVHLWVHTGSCNVNYGEECRSWPEGCWRWVGSLEKGTLSSTPSLDIPPKGTCGYHGYLIRGELIPCSDSPDFIKGKSRNAYTEIYQGLSWEITDEDIYKEIEETVLDLFNRNVLFVVERNGEKLLKLNLKPKLKKRVAQQRKAYL